jgi:hypothetical protein
MPVPPWQRSITDLWPQTSAGVKTCPFFSSSSDEDDSLELGMIANTAHDVHREEGPPVGGANLALALECWRLTATSYHC